MDAVDGCCGWMLCELKLCVKSEFGWKLCVWIVYLLILKAGEKSEGPSFILTTRLSGSRDKEASKGDTWQSRITRTIERKSRMSP